MLTLGMVNYLVSRARHSQFKTMIDNPDFGINICRWGKTGNPEKNLGVSSLVLNPVTVGRGMNDGHCFNSKVEYATTDQSVLKYILVVTNCK